jgi:hypothetical protein
MGPQRRLLAGAFLIFCLLSAAAQAQQAHSPVTVSVVDENGVSIPGAEITVMETGQPSPAHHTDYAGQCSISPLSQNAYTLRAAKPGFYETVLTGLDPADSTEKIVMAHVQIVREEVNVTASVPGIDTTEVAGEITMNTPEIVNIPYETSRDIRNLLPFNPGVIQDATGQIHVDGSETWETLDLIDGFDVRSPVSGTLDMRVSTDAVRTVETKTTRLPAEFGRSTGGVVALYTGMGDNKFRFNATNFVPSFREANGLRFDQFVPRFTFSGPLKRNRAWWYGGVETEINNMYTAGLPAEADTSLLVRGSNLLKAQVNLSSRQIVTLGLLFNDYHSPYEGLSTLVPQASTIRHNIIAWLPYLRDQLTMKNGTLLEAGVGHMRYRDGYEPHGSAPYAITPEQTRGSFFQSKTMRSSRWEGYAAAYLPSWKWMGTHSIKTGIDLDHIDANEDLVRAPVGYLREDGTLTRQSVYSATAPFSLHNAEAGAYIQDKWQMRPGLLVESGVRLDWDEILRSALISPRLAAVYSPPGAHGSTKISAGIGLYYEHTQLQYLTRAFEGVRVDTYYQADGVTPADPAQTTDFVYDASNLRQARAVNWSLGLEQKLPGSILAGANVVEKRTSRVLTYENQSQPASLSGNYALASARLDHYDSFEVNAKRLFSNGHAVFLSYTRSRARTNSAVNYQLAPAPLGFQQSGPLPWDTPNRLISWGWLPLELPKIKKNWDFVYTVDWHSGFPYTSVNDNDQVVGAAGSRRFPDFLSFSPGLEWRFHFRGTWYGLRGVMENGTGSSNPMVVNNVVDSPQYGQFSEPQGRAFTARIRVIGRK